MTLQSQYGTSLGSGWYDAGSTVPVKIQSEIDYENATRRIFRGWTGDTPSSSSNLTLRMNSPHNLNAQWSTQYMITFKVIGVSNATVIKLNTNNVYHDISINRNYQAWYEKDATINPALNETILDGFFIYKFAGWRNSTGTAIQTPLTVKSPATYVATYSTEVALPAIPGFPTEAIIIGILLGLVFLTLTRRKRKDNSFVPIQQTPQEHSTTVTKTLTTVFDAKL
jgi:hypothetical protein